MIHEDRRRWWVLAGACSGLFILMLDSTVVALALPEIRQDIGATATGLQWVLNVYLLVLAVLVVTAGRLGDMFGRKRLFLAGMVAFGAGSAICGLAPSEGALIAGRVVQGVGAAALITLSLAIVCNAFPGDEQARALGIWAGVSALALAVGPVVGGILAELDWRLIFWINVPICAAGFLVMVAAAEESTDPSAGHRLDIPGLATFSAGLVACVFAVVQSQSWGWGSPATLGMLAAGLALLVAFCVIEGRVARPMVDFSLFRNGPFLGASAAAFCLVGPYWGLMFFEPQYLQEVAGHSPTLSGLLILPITAPMVALSPFSARLIARFGSRALMTAGMLCGVAGLVVLTRIDPETSYGLVAVGYVLFGIALGLVYAPMSTAAMAAMPAEKVGIASGVLAMVRVLAGSVLLAVIGTVFQSAQSDRSGRALDESGPGAAATAFTDGLADATWVMAVVAAVGAIATWLLVRDPAPTGAPDPDSTAEHRQHHRRFHL